MALSLLPTWWCLLCCLAALPDFGTATAPTDFKVEDKKAFVLEHNRLRQSAAPAVANMHLMGWSDTLAADAKKAVEKCPKKRADVTIADKGFNLYAGENRAEAITSWYSQKAAFNHAGQTCSPNCQCDDYQNIISPLTSEIGCAYNDGCSPKVVICVYNKKPETSARKLGLPCSQCPAVTTKCQAGLCATDDQVTNAATKHIDDINNKFKDVTIVAWSADTCRVKCATAAGVSQATAATTCACTCPTGTNSRYGSTCQHEAKDFDDSVRLKFESTETPKKAVSWSLFNEKIWSVALKTELAEAVNTWCRTSDANFKLCCPGKTTETWTSSSTNALVTMDDVELMKDTIGNQCDGSLNLNVYVKVDPALPPAGKNKLCPTGRTDSHVKGPDVLMPALKAKLNDINAKDLLTNNKAKLAVETSTTITKYWDEKCASTSTTCDASPGGPVSPSGTPKPGDKPGTVTGSPKPSTPAPQPANEQGKPGKAASFTTASLALMLISCFCAVALLAVSSQ